MRTVTIELPDTITINGMKDAPNALRVVPTEKWEADFCLTAITYGVSQKLHDTWSVTKKNKEKTQTVYDTIAAGEWNRREQTGISDTKFKEKIQKLDIKALLAAMTPEQHAAILAAGGDITAAYRTKPAAPDIITE